MHSIREFLSHRKQTLVFFSEKSGKIGAINLLIHLGLWINSVYLPYSHFLDANVAHLGDLYWS